MDLITLNFGCPCTFLGFMILVIAATLDYLLTLFLDLNFDCTLSKRITSLWIISFITLITRIVVIKLRIVILFWISFKVRHICLIILGSIIVHGCKYVLEISYGSLSVDNLLTIKAIGWIWLLTNYWFYGLWTSEAYLIHFENILIPLIVCAGHVVRTHLYLLNTTLYTLNLVLL